jgi:Rnl2 family RNA ligase
MNAPWPLIPYPKITERIESLGLDERAMRATRRVTFVAREKIHGANLALYTDGAEVRASRRKAWLDSPEDFFGCGSLLASLEALVRALHRALGLSSRARCVVYGELFGGAYPHPEVAPVAGVSSVQSGVWYSPSLAFAAFDVAVRGDDGAVKFLGAREVDERCANAGIFVAPTLATGSLADALATPMPFETRVPSLRSLPRIDDNLAEGIVVTPLDPLRAPDGVRLVLKRKIERFTEDPSRYDQPAPARPFSTLFSLVTEARVASAWSKAGGLSRPEPALEETLVALVTDDARESWLETHPDRAHLVHDRSEPYVTLRAEARRAVREFLDARGR